MIWNIDFEIASMLLQIVFLAFFFAKKHLPTRQNRLYIVCVFVSLICTFIDILTAIGNSYPNVFGINTLYFINTVYFAILSTETLLFFVYILTISNYYKFTKTLLFAVFCTPSAIMILLSLLDPMSKLIFYFDEAGVYRHGSCYMLEYIVSMFYIVCSIIFISLTKNINRMEKISIYIFCTLILMGAVAQGTVVKDVLLTNAATAIALLIVYLALDNPGMYVDRNSGIYNKDAFCLIAEEYRNSGKSFSSVLLTVTDIEKYQSLYGAKDFQAGIDEVNVYLKQIVASQDLFFLENGKYLISVNDNMSFQDTCIALENRFSQAFVAGDSKMLFRIQLVVMPYWNMSSSIEEFFDILDFAQKHCGSDKQIIEIDDGILKKFRYDRIVDSVTKDSVVNNRIQLHFQPVYSVKSGKIEDCEVLARLFDEETGFISPVDFINKAEENGTIIKLGHQIFEKVCNFIKEEEPQKYGLKKLHINLTQVQCVQEDMVEDLVAITDSYGVERSLIGFEITESVAAEHNETILRNMEKLIAAGFTCSLDDYGLSHSNISAIISLPLTSLKFDKILMWKYFGKENKIISDMVKLFHDYGFKLIAEGVENEVMLQEFEKLEFEYLQGFYFAKPLPSREFLKFIRSYNRDK